MKNVDAKGLGRYLEQYEKDILEAADAMRGKPLPVITEELFSLYETSGNRTRYEHVYFLRRKFLAVFSIASFLWKKPEDLEKLSEVIRDICAEECWALPAHVNRESNPEWRITVDLFASETAQAVAETISLLQEFLPGEVYNLAKENIFRRVLEPFRSSTTPYSWWEGGDNNWNAVCCGSIGSAALYLMRERPEELERLLERLRISLQSYVAGFGEDGTCMEGLAYFSYGMTYYTGLAQQWYEYSGGKVDLMEEERLEAIALFQQKCYFGSGRTVSFSDGEYDCKYRMGLSCYLARRYPAVTLPPLLCAGGFNTDSCYRYMANYRDIVWTKQYQEELQEQEKQEKEAEENIIILSKAQWEICRGKSGGGLAAKGGHNGEAHNHNDVGSFLYILGRDMLLTDLGAGEYTKDYFGEKRYEILCNSSLGHSVPIINGMGQKDGREYGCQVFDADGKGRLELSFAGAYDKGSGSLPGCIEKIERTLQYDPEREILVVQDRFLPSRNTVSIEENLVTQFEPYIRGNRIDIAGETHACRIFVEDCPGNIECRVMEHKNHIGRAEKVYCIRWKTPFTQEGGACSFRIEPVLRG